jgi:two-component system response regulator HydG
VIESFVHPTRKPAPLHEMGEVKSIQDNERDHIISILNECDWKIYGKGGAAELLKINPSTLNSRMKKLNIVRP